MTVSQTVTITCDFVGKLFNSNCPNYFHSDYIWPFLDSAREAAGKRGWVSDVSKDACPEHAEWINK